MLPDVNNMASHLKMRTGINRSHSLIYLQSGIGENYIFKTAEKVFAMIGPHVKPKYITRNSVKTLRIMCLK